MASTETKTRIPLWLYPGTLALVDESFKNENCKSRSEFIEKAILFYSDYITMKSAGDFLPKTLSSILSGIVQTTEDRVARLLFKLAVEQCMMMHVIAETSELPERYLEKLRGKCVKEVKKSIGAVRFDSAVGGHDEFSLDHLGE